MKKSIYKNGKNLRFGYTTGSCAAAATKAAVKMLVSGKLVDEIDLMTPKGWLLNLDVIDIEMTPDKVICGIVKDSGDDPDITNGMTIYAEVTYSDQTSLTGGIGVGMVTKKGLSVPIGEYAINPVPRQMIFDAIEEVCDGLHVSVKVFMPEGVELAKKTFNPRLGIVGGLSIIGTTGIVEPMSEEAFKDSLNIELKQIHEDTLVMAPGNYGRDYCVSKGVNEERIIKTSNFIGYMFERAVEQKKKKILFAGHIGKLIKVAGGIFHTHSRVSDARMDLLTSFLVRINAPYEDLHYVLGCNTTEEAVNYIVDKKLTNVFLLIANSIKQRLELFTFDQIEVEVIVFSMDQGWLSQTSGAEELLEVLSE
ncbi:cobalamin biosynthesis protein CbiD [Acidaminobacter sp. JC074]|uniref:cobalt-precorrin-5B (C(1))-methyltransferase CbiD n=1 Tax=Acidaminobacter sp. JC074 TaxID=2530199 RepID=UPI001F100F1F|nr:cobalt-precorrin-5B (C(1))-methyltransferase CbiD [Acidaminobacter sp. JC074]MCH4888269.1 cobalamin biosynthesis protein CbiD [Acidaminobacter sp. JC074]